MERATVRIEVEVSLPMSVEAYDGMSDDDMCDLLAHTLHDAIDKKSGVRVNDVRSVYRMVIDGD